MTHAPTAAAEVTAYRNAAPTSIRSMFRILATDIALSRDDHAWLAVARPVVDAARKRLDEARAGQAERTRFVENCVIGLIALSRARLSWDTGSMLPDLAVMLADRSDSSGRTHANELWFVVADGTRAKLFGTQLAGMIAESLALLGMPIPVRLTEARDASAIEEARWRLIWGTPTALQDFD